MRPYFFTSESVSEGHPDKVCDRISDMVVDTYLSSGDPQTRVACETLTTTNKVVLAKTTLFVVVSVSHATRVWGSPDDKYVSTTISDIRSQTLSG